MRLCVQPFKGAIRPPTNHSQYDKKLLNQQPNIDVQIEYVFGYRSKDCRNNIHFLKNGNIVYHAAAVGVVMDIKKNEQRFFNDHEDDIMCISVDSKSEKVATGSLGFKPTIYVWDPMTMETLNCFQGDLQNGITQTCFTPDSNQLIAIASDVNHHIAIYDLTDNNKKGGSLKIVMKSGMDAFTQLVPQSQTEFVTIGPKVMRFWKVEKDIISNKKAHQGKFEVSNIYLALLLNGKDTVCGAQDGTLQVYRKGQLNLYKMLHSKALGALAQSNSMIITGGNDGIINIIDKEQYMIIKNLKADIFQDCLSTKIRAITIAPNDKALVVGTFASELYLLNTKDQKITGNTQFTCKNFMKGHFTPSFKTTNEVWGLAEFPNNPDLYATCGDDGTLRVFSQGQKKIVKCISINIDCDGAPIQNDPYTGELRNCSKGRAIAVSPNGNLLVVGALDGTIRVFDRKFELKSYFQHSKEWISDMKFSPDGKTLAIGSHDNAIYIYSIGDDDKLKMKFNKPLNKHSSYITKLDFSEDGHHLHSTCGAYDLLFWDLVKGRFMGRGATALKDEKWHTWTVPIGWQGIFKKEMDGTDINSVDRTKFPISKLAPEDYHVVACATDFSRLNLYKYPVLDKKAECLSKQGHSSHVTNVKFINNDKNIVTTGGDDQCVFQWAVKQLPSKKPNYEI